MYIYLEFFSERFLNVYTIVMDRIRIEEGITYSEHLWFIVNQHLEVLMIMLRNYFK